MPDSVASGVSAAIRDKYFYSFIPSPSITARFLPRLPTPLQPFPLGDAWTASVVAARGRGQSSSRYRSQKAVYLLEFYAFQMNPNQGQVITHHVTPGSSRLEQGSALNVIIELLMPSVTFLSVIWSVSKTQSELLSSELHARKLHYSDSVGSSTRFTLSLSETPCNSNCILMQWQLRKPQNYQSLSNTSSMETEKGFSSLCNKDRGERHLQCQIYRDKCTWRQMTRLP
ncbi:uncharacterized protein isoform X2 [Macaca fascicularis]|uniref:uncharacterized protein isoform X2 n=1 Tax=Macaca fascicularis TaxID=9541 RepID=UPI001E252F30|nr:uncharacterized protein LOC102133231 [Macaca fascicularis]